MLMHPPLLTVLRREAVGDGPRVNIFRLPAVAMMLEVLENVDGTRACPGIVQALVALFGTQMRHMPDDIERSGPRERGSRTPLAGLSRADKASAAIGERAELLQRFFHDGVQPPAPSPLTGMSGRPGRRLVSEREAQVRVDHDIEAVAQLVKAFCILVGCLAHQRPGEALVLDVEADLVIRPVGPQGCPNNQGRKDGLNYAGREFVIAEIKPCAARLVCDWLPAPPGVRRLSRLPGGRRRPGS